MPSITCAGAARAAFSSRSPKKHPESAEAGTPSTQQGGHFRSEALSFTYVCIYFYWLAAAPYGSRNIYIIRSQAAGRKPQVPAPEHPSLPAAGSKAQPCPVPCPLAGARWPHRSQPGAGPKRRAWGCSHEPGAAQEEGRGRDGSRGFVVADGSWARTPLNCLGVQPKKKQMQHNLGNERAVLRVTVPSRPQRGCEPQHLLPKQISAARAEAMP